MAGGGSGRGIAFSFCSSSPPNHTSTGSLQLQTMSCGGNGDGCAGGGQNPMPPRVHPRYVPRRGAVLKQSVRGVLGFFLSPLNGSVTVGGRVRPGGDGAAVQED